MNDADRKSVPACTLVIFGASGDLTQRLLLPSLYNLRAAGLLPEQFHLLGVAVEPWSEADFQKHIADTLRQFWGPDADPAVVHWLSTHASYVRAETGQNASLDTLKQALSTIQSQPDTPENCLFYLAVAPKLFAPLVSQLAHAGLLTEDHGWRRIVLEKPFGVDLASAIELTAELHKSVPEAQIFRIDHFAGRDPVRNVPVFRFANSIFEPVWNASMISNVQITLAETIGVEKRAAFYEGSGALRDMVPNHIAELLSLVAMEPPASMTDHALRDEQVKLLQAIRPLAAAEVQQSAVRGQYGAGTIRGAAVPGYRNEPDVRPDSPVETYVAMRVDIDNSRWAGVPFYLRTGKRLAQTDFHIAVTFREPPASLFAPKDAGRRFENRLVFRMQPTESVELVVETNASGMQIQSQAQTMTCPLKDELFNTHAKGYERLLHDAMVGDRGLFRSPEFTEAGWRMVQPLLDAWANTPPQDFPNYAAGSDGPKAADDLLAGAGHSWCPLV